ncbi:MAG: hypothetical protein HY263_04150 [Chloroflexi bacterium]|nr:hypothetical protein [Chloroflexota bacterium]
MTATRSAAFRRAISALLVFAAVLLAGGIWLNSSYGVAFPWETPRFVRACGLEYDYISDSASRTSPGLVVSPVLFNIPLPIVGLSARDQGLPYAGCPIWIGLRLPSGLATYLPVAAP